MNKYTMLVAMLSFLCSGCATNAFNKFYVNHYANEPMPIPQEYIKTCSSPQVELLHNATLNEMNEFMYAKGYLLIGYSMWEGTRNHGNSQALAQAKKVGACFAVWSAKHVSTTQSTMAVPVYTHSTTSSTNHYGNVNTNGEYSSYQGYSTTSTPGTTTTTYVPISISRYDYTGAFFAEIINMPYSLMILTKSPPESYMRLTDSRNGCFVRSVMKGGNAYKANIFAGDIIMSINGESCNDNSGAEKYLKKNAVNELIIYRNGKNITKQVSIPHDLTNKNTDLTDNHDTIALQKAASKTYSHDTIALQKAASKTDNPDIIALQKAANLGDMNAQIILASVYIIGKKVKQDYVKAMYYYKLAAKQGHLIAQHNLGLMYAQGLGIEHDYLKAIYWFEQSARQGNATSQYHLGTMYAKGYGVNKNLLEAKYYYKQAAAQGHEKAKKELNFLN